MAGELRRAIAGLWKGCPDAQDADEREQFMSMTGCSSTVVRFTGFDTFPAVMTE